MNVEDRISRRIISIKPSASIKLGEKIIELKNKGVDIIDLSWGEPYFDTPYLIKESAKNALDNNFTHYTNSRGIIELREPISKKLRRENKIIYEPDTEILVTPGAKQAIFYAVYALIEEGDQVLIPEPYWLSYRDIVKLAGGKVVPIEMKEENYFKPRYEDIENKISERTKAIIINNPNNPTGMVLDKNNLEDIAEIAKEHDIIVISDEIYEKIISEYLLEIARVSTVPGIEYGNSGEGYLRISFAVPEKDLIKAAEKLRTLLETYREVIKNGKQNL